VCPLRNCKTWRFARRIFQTADTAQRLRTHSTGTTSATPIASCHLTISDIASRLFEWLSSDTSSGTPRKSSGVSAAVYRSDPLAAIAHVKASGRCVAIGSNSGHNPRGAQNNYLSYFANELTGPTSGRRRKSPPANEISAGAATLRLRSARRTQIGAPTARG
jgi:hypothetical protein